MRTFTFNTGRQYTKSGQLINAIEFSAKPDPVYDGDTSVTKEVWFNDTDRGITAKIEVFQIEDRPVTEAEIMDYYDRNKTEYLNDEDFAQVWINARISAA